MNEDTKQATIILLGIVVLYLISVFVMQATNTMPDCPYILISNGCKP